MNMINHLILLCDTYCSALGRSRSRVSTLVFNDGKVIDRLIGGADITVGRLETAVKWFSANWPKGVDWPDGIARPVPEPSSPEAA